MKISVVITAWNAAGTIERTLRSVSWADEIILINCTSADNTADIAGKYTPHVITRPNHPMLNVNKNFGFGKATGDWILSLDADEEIPPALAKEMQRAAKQKDVAGFWIQRKNIQFGKWVTHGIWWPDPQLRLFRRGKGRFPEKHVHEYLEVEGKTETLHEAMVHHNYDSISQFLWKMDTLYTPSEVARHKAAGYRVVWYDALRFPVSDFIKLYFAQDGYKDGLHGLVLALLQAMYSLVVFAKLWESEKFPAAEPALPAIIRELCSLKRELRYWIVTARIRDERSPIKKFILRLIRRI